MQILFAFLLKFPIKNN